MRAALSDVPALRAQLTALLSLPCMGVAREAADDLPRVQSVEGMKRWWQSGGERWLRQYLAPMPSVAEEVDEDDVDSREIVYPPTEPRLLSRETLAPNEPLQDLLCAQGDSACASESVPWLARMESVFETVAWRSVPMRDNDCEARARSARAADRYQRWYQCMNFTRPAGPQVPVVHAHAPTVGWLVVDQTQHDVAREHESGDNDCEDFCSFSFETGAAFCARACGTNDSTATTPVVRIGQVSLPYLRELGWYLLVMSEIPQQTHSVDVFRLADGLQPEWREPTLPDYSSRCGVARGPRRLSWAWTETECTHAAGMFEFPTWENEVVNLAGELFSAALRSVQTTDACVRSMLPRSTVSLSSNGDGRAHVRETLLLRALLDAQPKICE